MVNPKKILLVSIFGFASVFSIPQQVKNENNGNKYLAIHWGVEQGLGKERWHTALLKDVNGFMWLGSHYGELSRFDGSSFQQYEPDKNKPGTIQSTNILSFVEDSMHNIWMGRSNGLSRYDIKADTFTNFSSFIDSSTSNNETVIPFWATKNDLFCIEGGSWITSYNIHSFTRRKLIHIEEADSVQLNFASAPSSIFELSSNSVWMLAQNEEALVQFSLSTGKSIHFKRLIYKNKIVRNHHTGAEAMCYDRNRNCFWINRVCSFTL
jgi:ligand-binding sensor domain-containing protein